MFEPKTVRPLVGSALSESSKVKLSLAMELVVRPVFLSWEVLDFEKHHTSFFINCDGCDYGVLVSSCLVWYEWISTGTFRHVLLGAFSTRGYGFDRHGGFGSSTGLGWSTKATGVSDGGGCRHGGRIWSSQDTQISRCFYCFILIHNQHKMIQHWVCKPNFCINMCAVAIRLNWAIAFMAFAEWLETLHILGKEFWDLFEVVFLKLGWTRSVLRVQVGMKMGAIKSTTCHGMNLAMEQAANNSSHAMGWTKEFLVDRCFSVLSGERCSKVGMKNPPLDKASKKSMSWGFVPRPYCLCWYTS